MSALLHQLGGVRLLRAQTVLAEGRIEDLSVAPGRAQARVMGRSRYAVGLTIDALPATALEPLRKRPIALGRLLLGETALLDETTWSIFWPQQRSSIEARCSCPDGVAWCKHTMATLLLLESLPRSVMIWRGWSPERLLEAVWPPRTPDARRFWEGHGLERPLRTAAPTLSTMPELMIQRRDARGMLGDAVERMATVAQRWMEPDRK